jgi:hypothetical protein
MAEIPDGEPVFSGMFSMNGQPVFILFDSSATHSFISKACVQKHDLKTHTVSSPYVIRSPGGLISTNQMVWSVPLKLGEHSYYTDLIILRDQDIDVIVGMNWMVYHNAVLRISPRTLELNSKSYGHQRIELIDPNPSFLHLFII